MARKQGDSNFVRTCLRTQSTTELNQKLTKHSQKTLDTGRLHEGKYLCKNLGVKEGGGRSLEGGVFWGAYGTYLDLDISVLNGNTCITKGVYTAFNSQFSTYG